jgi:stage V sporulation protein S
MSNEAFHIKVGSKSGVRGVAGSIAYAVRDGKTPILTTIGAGAVNQGMKALAVARRFLEDEGVDLVSSPSFVELEVNGEECTALEFEVLRR